MLSNPHPPRFWWLKRVAPPVVLVGVAWAGFHLWLTRHVAAELAARVEAWRAEGDWPLPEQIGTGTGLPPPLVDGRPNAADLLLRARRAMPPLTSEQLGWDMAENSMPLAPQFEATVRQIVAQEAAANGLARRSRLAPAVDWDFPAGGAGTLLPYLNDFRELANHLSWSVALAHHDGRIADAAETAGDMFGVSRVCNDYCPCLVTSLVTCGIDAMASDRLLKLAWYRPPALSAEAEDAAWRTARPQVEEVISLLLDADHDASMVRRGFQGEATMMLNALQSPASAAALGLPRRPVIGAYVDLSMLRLIDLEARAAEHPRDAAAVLGLDAARERAAGSAAGAAARLLIEPAAPSFAGITYAMLRAAAARRAAAVVLAARLYRADTGRWPASFDDLVPACLPRVPDDPFAPAGTPMRLRTDGPLPLVYSVGYNGVDDNGSTRRTLPVTGWWRGPTPIDRLDLVYPLYLPPVAARFAVDNTFDVWDWLLDPAAAVDKAERLEVKSAAQPAAQSKDGPDDLGVEDQQRQPDGEDGEQQRPGEQQRDAAQTQPAD